MFDYPEVIFINGEEYKINTDYRHALEAIRINEDPNIDDHERAVGVIVTLFGDAPICEASLLYARKYLQCGEEEGKHEKRKPDMDYDQDKGAISAGFASDYQIDISIEPMHWYRFNELIAGFTPVSAMSRLRELRNLNPKDYDAKQRKEVVKAQKAVALKPKINIPKYSYEEEQHLGDLMSMLKSPRKE